MSRVSLSSSEKIVLISNFSTMLTAGISLLETVDSLLEDAKGNQKKILETVRADIVQGNYLSKSFSKFPNVFDKVTISIIKASEEAGTLDVALKDLKENIQKEIEFTNRVKSALIYPAIIMVVFAGVLLLLLTFVVPKIASVFLKMRVELPLSTRIMIAASDLLLKNTLAVIAGFAVAGVLIFFFWKREKTLITQFVFSLPLVSNLAKAIDLTRFTRSMYLLLSAGIPIITALELAENIVSKKEIMKAIKRSQQVVLSGRKLSAGFKEAKGTFPSIMIKITEAGEKTGTLDKSMKDISEFLDYQTSNILRTLTTLLEPLMLVVVGVAVGGMMMAIIAPIYGLIGQVGGR